MYHFDETKDKKGTKCLLTALDVAWEYQGGKQAPPLR